VLNLQAVITKQMRELEILQRQQFQNGLKLKATQKREAVKRVRFTRELVLEGIHHREQILVPELGEGAFVSMRPLTDNEFVKVQKAILGDLTAAKVAELESSVQDLVEREQKGKYLAVSLSLSVEGDEWTPDDVGELPPGVPDMLYSALAVISGFPRPLELSEKKEEETG